MFLLLQSPAAVQLLRSQGKVVRHLDAARAPNQVGANQIDLFDGERQ